MRVAVALALILLALPAAAYEWEYVGMDGISATNITVDPVHERVFVSTYEGFWYFDQATSAWVERDWEDWIGRTAWAVDYHDDLDQRVITGRENAWFKGYMEYSEDLGASEVFAYESTGGRVTDVMHHNDNYWACTWSDIAPGEFLRSTDGGLNWTPVAGHGFYAMTDLTLDLNEELVLVGDAGVKRSWDFGDSWQDLNGDLPGGNGVYCAQGAYPGGDVMPDVSLFVSIDPGLYYSENVGQWIQVLDASCRDIVRLPVNTWLHPDRIATVTWDGRVMVSLGFAYDWHDETGDLPGTPLAMAFSNHDRGLYVITAQHGLWRKTHVTTPVESTPPAELALNAYPNPFNPKTRLRFSLPEAGRVSLRIYDVSGREVARLLDEPRAAGEQSVSWNAEAQPSGVYLALLETAAGRVTQRLVLLK
jgi:hypothetical protein